MERQPKGNREKLKLALRLRVETTGNDNDLELDRQNIEHGHGGFAGEHVARKEMKPIICNCVELTPLEAAWERAMDSFSGDRSFVRLFTKIYFQGCHKELCWIFWKRYNWHDEWNSPTDWEEYKAGWNSSSFNTSNDGYAGLQFAEEAVPDAVKQHINEVQEQ